LPKVPVPKDDPVTVEKVALGRRLFFDRRLSRNNTISCAMCHIPEQGFTNNEIATAVGIEGQTVRRNAPTIYNAAYAKLLFHDGRETRLEQQIWGPLLARNEWASAVGYVPSRIRALPATRAFQAAFDGRGLTMETLGMALASYERTLLSANSPFDRWHFGKERGAISPSAARGFQLFTVKAGCAHCHTIAENYALFTDQQLPTRRRLPRRAMATSSRRASARRARYHGYGRRAARPDRRRLGRTRSRGQTTMEVQTPGLRPSPDGAVHMHDGSLATLREVVDSTTPVAPNRLSTLRSGRSTSVTQRRTTSSYLNATNQVRDRRRRPHTRPWAIRAWWGPRRRHGSARPGLRYRQAASSRATAAAGSSAPITSRMTATPCAPACSTAAAFSTVTPPTA
jgi:cytochrome c peroxidase